MGLPSHPQGPLLPWTRLCHQSSPPLRPTSCASKCPDAWVAGAGCSDSDRWLCQERVACLRFPASARRWTTFLKPSAPLFATRGDGRRRASPKCVYKTVTRGPSLSSRRVHRSPSVHAGSPRVRRFHGGRRPSVSMKRLNGDALAHPEFTRGLPFTPRSRRIAPSASKCRGGRRPSVSIRRLRAGSSCVHTGFAGHPGLSSRGFTPSSRRFDSTDVVVTKC